MEIIHTYLMTYGYFAIFFFLFLGITGIPSPEESFMIMIGIAISGDSLNLYYSLLFAFLGALSGMITAYLLGYFLGKPFVHKYGKYIGLTSPRYKRATIKFNAHAVWAITLSFFIPGLRQINPYLAGIMHYPFLYFTLLAGLGALFWTITFVLLGYFLGQKILIYLHFKPEHVALVIALFLTAFAILTIIRFIRKGHNDSTNKKID